MEELQKLIGKEIIFVGKEDKATLEHAYKIETIKKEFENEKMNRVNFFLIPNFTFLHELNIKLCTKDKTLKEIFAELCVKTRETVGENSFMKEAISIVKMIDKKATITIKPIIYKKKNLVFNVNINDMIHSTEYNPKETTVSLLTKWGLYKNYKNAIDFYLICDPKKESNKTLLKKLLNNEEVSLDLIKSVAKDTKKENKNKVYMVLEKLISKEILTKQALIFKNRRKLYKIYKDFSENLPIEYKAITLRWIREEVENFLLAKDPNNTICVFDIEFKTANDEIKKEISDIEGLAKKVWNYYENKINTVLKDKKIPIRIAIDTMDFLTDELNVKIIKSNSVEDDVINTNKIKEDLVRIIKKTYKND